MHDFTQHGYRHIDWVADYLDNVRQRPVLPAVAPGDITAKLPDHAPETGEPIENIFADFEDIIVPGLTLWNHPRYFAYFANSSPPPCILADLLISALNVNLLLWKTSPAATELETVTLNWLRDWLGLSPEFFGITYDTASTAVLHALAAARERIAPECRTDGMHPGLMIYVSEHTHSSAEKSAIFLGFGQSNVRRIPVDEQFRMRPDLLEKTILGDKAAGRTPCCIVASVGSTSTSAIEPVPAIADIAQRYGIWLHVDGAYGASAAVVPEMRHILDGVERADSFIINPHKWLYVSVDCSVLYIRDRNALRRAAELNPEYLRTAEDDRALNLNEYGVQLGRRFRGLKLWYVMRYYGRQGIQELLRKDLRLTQLLKGWIESDSEFEIAAPAPLSLVCFRHKGGDDLNRQLLDAINATGQAFLSHTVLNGKFTLRFAIGNYQTNQDDVRDTWELIRNTAARLALQSAECHPA